MLLEATHSDLGRSGPRRMLAAFSGIVRIRDVWCAFDISRSRGRHGRARRDIIGKEQVAERVKQDLKEMSRKRSLPDETDLGEGHPLRSHTLPAALKALRGLEALQIRRSGGAALPAGLDVQGMEH